MYWLWIFIIGFIAGILFDMVVALFSGSFKHKEKSKHVDVHHLKMGKIRIHHSCIGLCCWIAAIFVFFTSLFSFGLGLIISHSIREKSALFLELHKKDGWKPYF